MGANVSINRDLCDNELLKRLAGLEPIDENDPFWNLLLSFNFKEPAERAECQCVDEKLKDLLQALSYNSSTTGNFNALVRVFLRRSTELRDANLCDDKLFFWQTSNALLIIRYCCKYFAQHLNDEEYAKIFSRTILNVDGQVTMVQNYDSFFQNNLEEFTNMLLTIVCDVQFEQLTTANLLIQSLACLMAMMSSELYNPNVQQSQTTKLIFFGKCSVHAPVFTKALLNYYVKYSTVHCHYETDEQFGGGSFVVGLASSLMSIFHANAVEKAKGEEMTASLGDLGLCCLLVLVSHCASETVENPYRKALFSFVNSQEHAAQTCVSQTPVYFKFNFANLYDRLCVRSADRPSLLLLYFLVYKNVSFRNYILSRINLEQLLIPILKVLHDGEEYSSESDRSGSQHVYLALIVILIFSEDDFFCKVIHEMPAKRVPWFNERHVTEATLGSVIIYTLLKIVQKNVFVFRDRYLQTNCLAALANMSSSFKDLPPFICHRLIDLLDKLSKRHSRFLKKLELSAKYDLPEAENGSSEMLQDISVLEEAMRMLMEIFNSILSANVGRNVHFVYAVLYHRELFHSLEQYSMFHDLIWNIAAVINYFSSHVSGCQSGAGVEEVVDQLRQASVNWNADSLKSQSLQKFPELKFRYVEDKSTEDFFVPYIWKIFCDQCKFYPDMIKVKLFSPEFIHCLSSSSSACAQQ